jgi:hypothetical protein
LGRLRLRRRTGQPRSVPRRAGLGQSPLRAGDRMSGWQRLPDTFVGGVLRGVPGVRCRHRPGFDEQHLDRFRSRIRMGLHLDCWMTGGSAVAPTGTIPRSRSRVAYGRGLQQGSRLRALRPS